MNRHRVPKIIVSILLLIATIGTTYSLLPSNVAAAASVSLSPTTGSIGATITFSGSGFSLTAGSCALSSPAVQAGYSCIQTASGTIGGSFIIANIAAGTYFITFTDTLGSPSASAKLTVSGQTIGLSSSSAYIGTTITFSGSGFTHTTGTCTLASPAVSGGYTCNQDAGGSISGSFVVANVGAGAYSITFADTTGSPSIAVTFTVNGPTVTLSSTSGSVGSTITFSGSGFSHTAGSCSLTSAAVSAGYTCSQTTSGLISGNFVVANVAGGVYSIIFADTTGSPSVSQQFTVNGPTVTLSSNSGFVGSTITFSGSGFTHTSGSCSLSSAAVQAGYSCTQTTSGTISGSFIVANTGAGAYTIIFTDTTGSPSALKQFTVGATQVILSPSSGPVDTTVTFTGSGFSNPAAASCTLSSPVVAGGYSCSTGPGTISGSFTEVETATPGTYVITFADSNGITTTASFTLIGASITLNPTSGAPGSSVTMTGSGFTHTVGACTFSSPAVTPVSCSQTASGTVSGSFTVANPGSGSYFVTVQDTQGAGYPTATTTFVVTGGPVVILSPNQGPTSTTVTVSGSGWNSLDTSVSFTAAGPGTLYSAPATRTCPIASGVISSCSFVVSSSAVGGTYTLSFTGNQGDTSSAFFVVISSLGVSPTNGPRTTSVTLSGSGYTAAVANCAPELSFSPNEPFTSGAVSCSISASGILAGSITVANTANPGPHTITITGSEVEQGSVSSVFTVTAITPTITLAPSSGPRATVASVSGSGFNPSDTTGTFSSSPAGLTASVSCTISGGSISAGCTFTVSSTATIGQVYTFTVTGDASDFGSATFLVTTTTPTITLTPNSGAVGTIVPVTGAGFNTADTSGTLSSSPSPLFAGSPTCTISSGQVSACSFTVTATTPGTYTVILTGDVAFDVASASFVLTSPTPTITLTPTSGLVGTNVQITGSGFSLTDTTCSVTSNPSSPVLLSPASPTCSISNGNLNTVFFTVASTATPGSYAVTVTGLAASDYAQASFVVSSNVPAITLTPNSANPGTLVSVTGSGFSPADVPSCSISGTPVGTSTCTISASGVVAGSFEVLSSATAGTYLITVAGAVNSAYATFTVNVGSITIIPPSGPRGTSVQVTGNLPTQAHPYTSCSISGSPVSQGTCVIGTSPAFTASFVVSNKAPGPYLITVTGSGSGVVSPRTVVTTFTVTGPTITLSPSSARIGATITVSGAGFSGSDTSCTISGTGTTTQACSISGGSGVVSGSFVVSNVQPGSYLITVTGHPTGDTAQAILTIVSGPSVTLIPALGTPGTLISVTGVGFLPAGSTCSISGTGVQNAACSLVKGTGTPTGSFTISNVNPGSYLIKLSSNGGDSATAVLQVSNAFTPTIIVTPPDGPALTSVSVTGTGFSTTDVSCQLTSSDALLITSPTCSVSAGKVTASFKVGAGATAGSSPTVKVTGNTGDFAQVTFTVDNLPVLAFNPASPQPAGTSVQVSLASGRFSSADKSCTITSLPTGLFSSSACIIQSGGLSLTGTFFTIKASAAAGIYTITVKGSSGDSASASFSVSSVANLQLTPTQGVVGSTVTFRATGFLSTDTGCVVQSQSGMTPNNLLIGSYTCKLSAGVATGSFVVGSTATSDITWNVTVKGTPGNDIPRGVWAYFIVVPQVTVSPTTGTTGTVVTVTGTGFASSATSCTLTVTPSAGFSITGCGTSGTTGQTAGSFTVSSAVAGLYVVTITDSVGKLAAATFQVGSPSATLTITPNIVQPGYSGALSGTGFNPQDISCTITPSIFSSVVCSVSGGIVAGSFTVSSSAIPGLYVVTITGDKGDFASNFLSVPATTGTATTSTSTTTSVTTTTATSITTSIPVTLTTTTFTNTGISTDRSYTLTTTTITGQSTYAISSTTTYTYIITSSTSTTVSTMITTSHIFGQAISPPLSTASSGVNSNLFGLASIIGLLGWILLRRWLF